MKKNMAFIIALATGVQLIFSGCGMAFSLGNIAIGGLALLSGEVSETDESEKTKAASDPKAWETAVTGKEETETAVTEEDTSVPVREASVVEETAVWKEENIRRYGKIKICLPDNTWSGLELYMGIVYLYKDGHSTDDQPTVIISIEDNGLRNSMREVNSFVPALPDSDFELKVGPYTCVGDRTKLSRKTTAFALIDRVFYPINEITTLRFNIFVKDGAIDGLEKDDPEILSIIQSVIELNGFGASEPETIETDYPEEVKASGNESKITCTLNKNGILHIGGDTEMVSLSNAFDYPWAIYRADVTEIQFDTEITNIPDYAFKKFQKLKKVVIPPSVRYLGEGCFEECTALEEITIPGSIRHINDYAFSNCKSLKAVWITPGVESLGNNVFEYCSSLEHVFLPKTIQLIGKRAFYKTKLQDTPYEGSREEYRKIKIEEGNDDLILGGVACISDVKKFDPSIWFSEHPGF